MPVIHAAELKAQSQRLLLAAGCTEREANIVSEHLVESSLVGHDSHGVMRLLQYLDEIEQGEIVPGQTWNIVRDWSIGSVIDVQQVFGQVACHDAMQLAIQKARQHSLAAIALRGTGHTGRLGAYVTQAAEQGMIGIVMGSGGGAGKWVAPFGGCERRIGTNPLAFGAPSGKEFPIVLDMGTSIVPEGKIRHYQQQGEAVPAGWLIDHRGQTSTNPDALYADPPGAIMSLGGNAGHKGFGLAVMVDIMAGALTGVGCIKPEEDKVTTGGGLFVMAINPSQFGDPSWLEGEIATMTEFVNSCKPVPPIERVMVPGQFEHEQKRQREKNGVMIAETVWDKIQALAN